MEVEMISGKIYMIIFIFFDTLFRRLTIAWNFW
jgi:hypothetical protein